MPPSTTIVKLNLSTPLTNIGIMLMGFPQFGESKHHTDPTYINEREIFVYAFRLGARIAIEVLSPDYST